MTGPLQRPWPFTTRSTPQSGDVRTPPPDHELSKKRFGIFSFGCQFVEFE